MSDEEKIDKILQLLSEKDGALEQQEITETYGWSEAAISNYVSELEKEGEIEVYRIGRENLIYKAGEEPEIGL
jgi:uncharacterized membrane protein